MKPLICLNLALLSILIALCLTPGQTIHYRASQTPSQRFLTPITNYSAIDSCHYPVKGGCLTASGTIASETTIACPRHWPFGVKVLIESKEYICEDRYNSNLSDRIDLWAGYGKKAHLDALAFGIQVKEIIIK